MIDELYLNKAVILKIGTKTSAIQDNHGKKMNCI